MPVRARGDPARGAEFVPLPNKGRYELYYNRNADIVACDDEIRESLLDVAYPKLTTLRVSAVRRLARGNSTTASGTAVTTPLDPRASAAAQRAGVWPVQRRSIS